MGAHHRLAEPCDQRFGESNESFPGEWLNQYSRQAVLTWTAATNATSHNVYFGTTSTVIFQINTSNTFFVPGLLAGNTTNFWRIDEIVAGVTNTGDLWQFTNVTLSAFIKTDKPVYN